MHNLGRFSHFSIVWKVALGILLLGIVGVHIVGANFLRSNMHAIAYIWPLMIVAAIIVIWHMRKLYVSQSAHQDMAGANTSESDIVTKGGLHWHPEIAIYVKGIKQEIPQTGITNMDMSKLHALHKKMAMRHMNDGPNEQGIIHLKFEGVVRRSDIMLGQVFKKWGKDFHSYGSNVKMFVNGKESTEYENYVMQDKGKIELRYE